MPNVTKKIQHNQKGPKKTNTSKNDQYHLPLKSVSALKDIRAPKAIRALKAIQTFKALRALKSTQGYQSTHWYWPTQSQGYKENQDY